MSIAKSLIEKAIVFDEYLSLKNVKDLFEKMDAPEDTQKLMDSIEKEFKKNFPNGFADVRLTRIIGNPFISISFGLIGSINDVSNKIRENDPALHYFHIEGLSSEGGLTDSMEVRKVTGSLKVKPEKDSHMAMGRVKIPFRKFKGDASKIESGFVREIKKIRDTVKKHKDDIYDVDDIDKKYLRGL